MLTVFNDEHFMRLALQEAERAYKLGEIPVGAVIVSNNRVIARGHNQTEQLNDVTAHAEVIAITAAANHLGGKYLNECSLYVTLEPCVMCGGALYWAQMGKVVYGASDPKRGVFRHQQKILHPKTAIIPNILAAECGQLMKSFFAGKR